MKVRLTNNELMFLLQTSSIERCNEIIDDLNAIEIEENSGITHTFEITQSITSGTIDLKNRQGVVVKETLRIFDGSVVLESFESLTLPFEKVVEIAAAIESITIL